VRALPNYKSELKLRNEIDENKVDIGKKKIKAYKKYYGRKGKGCHVSKKGHKL
jgi:hypothetical protein